MQATKITLFLINGRPNGLRTAEISNWSGKAIAAPRSQLNEISAREELSSAGIYILTGVDPETDSAVIYIDEAENIAVGVKEHAEKDFWNALTVFVSKDDNLSKTHVSYLADELIRLANENASATVINAKSSETKFSEGDREKAHAFLEKCLQLLPALGISDFQQAQLDKNNEKQLFCHIKDIQAEGQRTDNGFVVFKGSQAVLEHLPSAKSIRTMREKLITERILKISKDKEYLVFSKDVEFSSPSAAAGVVRGGSANGLTNWKNESGQTLKEIEASEN